MNKTKHLLIFLLLLISFPAIGQVLNEKLKNLEPLLYSNWVGEMKSPDGKKAFKINLSYEPLWDGEVIKFSRSVPEIKSFSEGYIYWDYDSSKILIFTISTRGAARESEVTFEEGKILVKGKLSIDNRTFDYKNAFEFTSDGKMTDSWFQNAFGYWQPGHVIVFSKEIAK
jgi:hypothetical protein